MIKRELYMSRIRPFIGTELVKVMTGIRRCGKSVMLELIQQELTESGVSRAQFIAINFEDMSYSHLQTAQALHDEITKRAKEIGGKIYLFFDEIQEVKGWEKCINSLRVSLDCDIYITGSNAKLLSGELATYLGGRYVEFVIYPFSFGAVPLDCARCVHPAVFPKVPACRRDALPRKPPLCGCAVQAISSRSVQLCPTQGHRETE
jgi:predicted AAA+ superfamily ATPase